MLTRDEAVADTMKISHQIISLTPDRLEGAKWITELLCFRDLKSKGLPCYDSNRQDAFGTEQGTTWEQGPCGCCHMKRENKKQNRCSKNEHPRSQCGMGLPCSHPGSSQHFSSWGQGCPEDSSSTLEFWSLTLTRVHVSKVSPVLEPSLFACFQKEH
jgi:hypothetical protein